MKTQTHGKQSVVAALLGNTFVTVMKTAVFFVTGSASMFAEATHSFADTLNQSLLLVGITRSKKPADDIHGYGYGIERFFWSLISACGILFIGAGITIYHSIDSLMNRGEAHPTFSITSIVILLAAFAIEGATLKMALNELRKGKKLSKKTLQDADPVLLAVIYEDGAAVLGVFIALIAQWMTYVTGDVIYDASGGILVGLILGCLAVVLIIKNHQYIIGKPLNREVTKKIIKDLLKDPCIEQVLEFKSVAIDIGKYRIFTTVEWNGSPLYEEIYEAGDLKIEYDAIKDDFKEFARLMFRTTDRIPRLVGNHIDKVEKKIIDKFPQIAYVDIEIN
ncbi:MAG: cation diffusion facilitator family transporter [Candidatus Moranbacteria bacterium]|nr:cation diffusion facilitator family transporter [Candidatus Moranbacteria bacterium]